MELLDKINTPADLRALPPDELPALCAEIRRFLVREIAATGGHLSSNLGAVELTVALHRVYDTEKDRLVFDVGHQCYVHKLLTGRRESFGTLRRLDGLSGFPKPCESVHDAFIAGHASNSVSAALGMARARTRLDGSYDVVALPGPPQETDRRTRTVRRCMDRVQPDYRQRRGIRIRRCRRRRCGSAELYPQR